MVNTTQPIYSTSQYRVGQTSSAHGRLASRDLSGIAEIHAPGFIGRVRSAKGPPDSQEWWLSAVKEL